MKRVTIEYRRFWHTVRREINAPEKWEELTARQFLAAVRLWSGTITQSDFLRQVFGFSRREVRHMGDYQRWVLLHVTDWMQNLKRPHNCFFLERIPKSSLYAPGPRLKGCSLQQFMTVDTFFSQYTMAMSNLQLQKGEVKSMEMLMDGAQQMLDQFIAALYKRHDETYSVEEHRITIGEGEPRLVVLDDHLPAVRKMAPEMKQAVLMNYVLIRSWLCKSFPHLFPEPEDADERPSNSPRQPKPVNWLSVFDSFVGDNVAQMEHYKAMAATDAFRVMNRRIRESKKRAAEEAVRHSGRR